MRIALLRVVALVAVSLAAAPAFAQAPVFDWSGFYLGAQAGFGQLNGNVSGNLDYDVTHHYGWPYYWANHEYHYAGSETYSSPSSGEIGVFAGRNWQLPNGLVVGGEADFNWADRTATDKYFNVGNCWHWCAKVKDLTTTSDWYGTARLRVGQSIGQLLLYGTAGLAFGDVSTTGDIYVKKHWNTVFSDSISDSGMRWGWAAGAGAQLAINERVSVKLEYLHVDLGNKTVYQHSQVVDFNGGCPGSSTVSGSLKNAVAFDTIKVGLAIRFP